MVRALCRKGKEESVAFSSIGFFWIVWKETVGRLKIKSNRFMGVNRFYFVICGRGPGGFLVLVPPPL